MNRSLAVLLAAAVLAGALAAPPARAADDAPPATVLGTPLTSAEAAGSNLIYDWARPLKLLPNERVLHLTLLGDTVYALTSGDRLLAVDANHGAYLWQYPIPNAKGTIYRPVQADGVMLAKDSLARPVIEPNGSTRPPTKAYNTLVLNTATHFIVLDRTNGRELRYVELPYPITGAGTTDGIRFYGPGRRSEVLATDLQTGVTAGKFPTTKPVLSPLAYFGPGAAAGRNEPGLLFAAGEALMLFAAVTGEYPKPDVTWKRELGAAVIAACQADARGVFVPCRDGKLYAFGLDGGNLWPAPYDAGAPLLTAPILADSTIFQYAGPKGLHAIDLVRGTRRWVLPAAHSVLALIDGSAYVLTARNVLLTVNEVTGEPIGSLSLKGFDCWAVNTHLPAVYVATSSGKVACLRPKR